MHKAQIFSLDMVIAAGIFILILLSAAALWSYAGEKISIEESRNDMEMIARNSMSSLVETKGNPVNWNDYEFNSTNIYSLGIADEFLVLNESKITSLQSSNYDIAKMILGILGPDYEFIINIDTWNGSAYLDDYEIGIPPNSTASDIVVVERVVLLNNTWAKTRMKLWKSCEDVTC